MEEVWKNIDNSYYEVSNFGIVRNKNTNRIMKYYNKNKLSPNIRLIIDGKKKNLKIHRLVAEAFIPNILNKPEVDHIDRNTDNNNINNLRWATRIENCKNRLFISEHIIKQIIFLNDKGLSISEIYKKIKN